MEEDLQTRLGPHALRQRKVSLLRDVFKTAGPERLAKVIPINKGSEYPRGSGIPQWVLHPPGIWFRIAAQIAPGDMYRGDYG